MYHQQEPNYDSSGSVISTDYSGSFSGSSRSCKTPPPRRIINGISQERPCGKSDLKLYLKFLNDDFTDHRGEYVYHLDVNRALPGNPFTIYSFEHFAKWCGFLKRVAFITLPESATTIRSQCSTKIITDKIFIEQFVFISVDSNWVNEFLACLFRIKVNKIPPEIIVSSPEITGVPPSWFEFQTIKTHLPDVVLIKPLLPESGERKTIGKPKKLLRLVLVVSAGIFHSEVSDTFKTSDI